MGKFSSCTHYLFIFFALGGAANDCNHPSVRPSVHLRNMYSVYVLSYSPQEEAAGWEKKAHKAVLAAACWLRDACFASEGKAELFVPLFCS